MMIHSLILLGDLSNNFLKIMKTPLVHIMFGKPLNVLLEDMRLRWDQLRKKKPKTGTRTY